MSNLHDNDVHIGVHASSIFGSADAEIFIDRTPRGVGPDARCALLVSTIAMTALTGAVRAVTLVRAAGRRWRALRALLADTEQLRAVALETARQTQLRVDAELRAIVAEVLGRTALEHAGEASTATGTPNA